MVKGFIAGLCMVVSAIMLVACGSVGRDAVLTVERSEFPVYDVPLLDIASYGNKVYVECTDEGFSVSLLPDGILCEQGVNSIVLRSQIPGVEYVISGIANDASITIASEFSPLVTLDALNLVARDRNALEVSSKEVIFLRSLEGSHIHDEAGVVKADNQSAAVKLMGRAVFCGGSFWVSSGRRSAVFCTDTLYLSDTQLVVSGAPNNALLSNNSIVLSSGSVTLHSEKDVLKCKNGDFAMCGGLLEIASSNDKADGVQAGNVYISGGATAVKVCGAASDGIKAKANLCIAGGDVDIAATGGALFNAKKSDYSSASCLKSDALVEISGGRCSFLSDGDGGKGISCDSMLVVCGGRVSVISKGGDMLHEVDVNAHASSKGIKCDGDIYIAGGDVEVAVLGEGERSEGVESKKCMHIGGDARLYVYAYDDALNAVDLDVSGGMTYIYSVANDAADSNGTFVISGGTLVADGSFVPEQGVDVDNQSAFTMSGGTLLTVGGTFGPYPSLPLGDGSTVPVVVWTGVGAAKNSVVSLAEDDGEVLFAYRMPRTVEGNAVLVASSGIKKGREYSFVLSDAVAEAAYVGNGLYKGGRATDVVESVSFKASGFVDCISDGDSVTVVKAGEGMSWGMMPPPFMGDSAMMNGAFPPPPMPGKGMPFPPPGMGGVPKGMPKGMMPPPFMGDSAMMNGAFPPPMPMRRINSEYGLGNLPNHDAR